MRHATPQAGTHAVGVIPARYQSSRFPGKPLALIDGRLLVERVFERARAARRLSRLLVATDDERIAAAVTAFGGEAIMTSPSHTTGTDRLAEVARAVVADVFVNIQGDEPLLDPLDVDRLVESLDAEPATDFATLMEPLRDPDEAANPNIVKVVCDAAGKALYFSRTAIPHVASRAGTARPGPWLRHVGLYAYRRSFLLEFASWEPGVLETIEGLEQLRALEHGRTIRVLPARGRYHGVDTPADVGVIEQVLRAR